MSNLCLLLYPNCENDVYGTLAIDAGVIVSNIFHAYDQVHIIEYTMDYCYTAIEKGDQ